MKKKAIRALPLFFVPGAGYFLWLLFWPARYQVPHIQPRPGMQYWHLPTGALIAYNHLPAKNRPKPYPIIYLHGGPGGPVTNKGIMRLLPLAEDGYDVYIYDQTGSGYSTRLADIRGYTADRHRADLDAIVRQIGAEKVILIGQSWGAILATLFAAAHPEKIAAIIFTSPGPIYPVNRALTHLKSPDSLHLKNPVFSNAQGNAAAGTLRTKLVTLWALWFNKKLADDQEMDDFYTKLSALTNRSTVCDTARTPVAEGGGGFYVQVMTMRSLASIADPRPALKTSTYPVLVMKGSCDNQPWGYTHEYLDVFPHHRLVIIPGAGHSIAAEQPEIYIRTILDFVNDMGRIPHIP